MDIKQSSTAYPLPFLLVLSSDHLSPATGLTPTVTLRKVGGSFAAPAGAVTEIANGWYEVAGNATDSNTLGPLLLHAFGTGTDLTDLSFVVVAYDPQDSVRQGMTALPNAAANAAGGLPVSIAGGLDLDEQNVDIEAIQTSTAGLTYTVANEVDVNVLKIAGTTQTARDIGASVLLSAGSGAGQLDFTSGVVKANLVQILATALTETAGQIAAAFKKFFNIASPASTMDHLTLIDTATNINQINGVSAASVTTINANLGMTQPVNFTGTAGSALVKSDMVDVAGAAVSTTSAQIGVNVVNYNTFAAQTDANNLPKVDMEKVGAAAVNPVNLGFPTGTNGTIKSTLSWIDNGGAANVSYFNNWCQNFLFDGIVNDSVFAPTTTQFEATFSQGSPSAAADAFKNCFVVFIGSLSMGNYAVARVTAYSKQGTKGHFTVTPALPAAPTNSDPFQVIPYGLVVADTVTDKTGYALTAAYDLAKTAAQDGDAMTLTAGERNATADALLARSLGMEGYAAKGATPTVAQALFMVLQDMQERSITSTTYTVKKLDGSTTAMTFTLNDATTPTSKTRAT